MSYYVQSKSYRPPVDETVVNIHKDNPYTHIERSIKGNWSNTRDEDVIDEVLRILFMELNPDSTIRDLSEKNDELKSKIEELSGAGRQINENIQYTNIRVNEVEDKVQRVENHTNSNYVLFNEISRQFILSENITDEQRREIINKYRSITVGDIVEPNEVVRIDDELYKMIQPSTITIEAENWLNDPSLFTPFLQKTISDEETGEDIYIVEEYRAPDGAHNAYNLGNKVLYNDEVYMSTIDDNVWSPSQYPEGWKKVEYGKDEEVKEEIIKENEEMERKENEEKAPISYTEFKQPTGGHDAYNTGDKVTFQGINYESNMDGNVWSPIDFPQGWIEIQ